VASGGSGEDKGRGKSEVEGRYYRQKLNLFETGSLLTAPTSEAGAAEDGIINVQEGDVISVTYVEVADEFGLPSTRSTSVTVGPIAAQASIKVASILIFENEPLCVTILEPDLIKPKTIPPLSPRTTAVLFLTNTSYFSNISALPFTVFKTTTIAPMTTASPLPSTNSTVASWADTNLTNFSFNTSNLSKWTTSWSPVLLLGELISATITRDLFQPQILNLSKASETGMFFGCIPTFTGQGQPNALNYAERGQTMTVTYSDNAFYGNKTAIAVVSRKGRINVSPRVIGFSRTLFITVTDLDLNQNFSNPEIAKVQVFSSWRENGNETILLTETGDDADNFTGILNTVLNDMPSPKNCDYESNGCIEPLSVGPAIHVREGDLLTFLYQDVAVGTHASEPANDITAKVRVGVKGIPLLSSCVGQGDGSPPLCGSVVSGGGVLNLQIDDLDLVFSQVLTALRTTTVTVTTSKDAEEEPVVLLETYPGSGRFTGNNSSMFISN
jgi:hypothetical protein